MIATKYSLLAMIAVLCVSCTGDTPTELARSPAANNLIHLIGDSILRAPNDPSFTESRRELRPGLKTAKGSCRFGGHGYLRPGEYAAERVVEVNPVTCDYIVAKGVFNHPLNSLSNRLLSGTRSSNSMMDDDYDEYSQALEVSTLGNSYRWQRLYWYDPVTIDVVWQRVRSWWDYDYHCTINVSGQGDARWLRASGWRLGTFDGEGHQGYDCSTHDHIVYGTYHNESWCAPWSVSLEIYTRNTIDALGGVTYDYWSNKDATSFACNTLWSGWESA